MGLIVCKMFGSPTIKENNEFIYLPSGKVSGVFYYLLIKKNATRDELAGLFWPLANEEKAKISLRNALHKLRKAFGEDIILTPNKSILKLNENVEFVIDTIDFEKNPMENFNLYSGEFLKGFFIKDAVDFDNWILEQRSYFEEIYINNIEQKISKDIENKKFENVEIYIRNLLSIDNFNEKAYQLLMDYYMSIGRYDKVINEYYSVQNILEKELGVEPSEKLEKIYKKAVTKVNEKQGNTNKKEKNILYERSFELNTIRKTLDDFYNEENLKSIVIRGEIGVGKTMLKKQIIKENKDRFNVFETNCYSVEQEFSFSPWHKIIFNLNKVINDRNQKPPLLWNDMLYKLFPDAQGDNIKKNGILENRENFNLDIIYNVIFSAIEQVSKDKKTIIVIEDIQWADVFSIKLLVNLALHLNRDVLFIITTTEEKNQKIDNLILSLKSVNKILVIDLDKFDRDTTRKIIEEECFKLKLTNEEIEDIYDKSKGNALFLKEYIELYKNGQKDLSITDNISDLLKTKFSNINIHERHILEKISLFYKDVSLDMLLKFGNTNAFDLVTAIGSLEGKNIIEAYELDNNTFIKFKHRAYRDYIYQNLNYISRKIMHLEVAKVLESEVKFKNLDVMEFVRIKNHYELANDKVKVIKYRVYILNYYLNYNHELFPNLDDFDLNNQMKIYMTNSKVLEELEILEDEILQIKNYDRNMENEDEINNIELMFLYCKGRYLIRDGNYLEGTRVMNIVINLAKELKDTKMLLSGYKQMVIYGIQINNRDIMLSHIIPALKVAKSLDDKVEQGVLLRLYGLYYLMSSDFVEAENLFNKSITMLSNLERISNNNSISIAADYNYIGEIRKAECNFKEATEYFNKSIDLCKENEASCLSIFYMNLGKTAFLMNDYKSMKLYFNKSKNIADKFDSYWEIPVVYSYLAISKYMEKDYIDSICYLKNANNEIVKINNPRDLGIIYFIESLISMDLKENNNEKLSDYKEFLSEPTEYYYYQALRYLDKYRDKGEIEYLNKILNSME